LPDGGITLEAIRALPRDKREHLALLLDEKRKRERQRRFFDMFPAETVRAPGGAVAELWDGTELWGRDLYPRHLAFFEAGARYRERCLMAANRVGKTEAASFELTAHLTGLYPDWWRGRRFTKPVRAWAAGKTNETTRDIVQAKLLGDIEGAGTVDKRMTGTGMIPGRLLGKPTWKQGVADLVDTIAVKHVSGGWSKLGLKSYQQGRGSFEGTAQHVIWGDEEPPEDVYGEMLIRTATTNGIVMLTFTPLDGLSAVVRSFMPGVSAGAG
jgi:phage terminase large subunit-like protein